MKVLPPADAYTRWAPSYGTETAVSALESSVVDSLGIDLRGRRVLDAGCGIARRLRDAHHAGAALAVGVDITPGMLAEAAGTRLLAAADVRALPVADRSFDVVWCRLVLGHLPDLARAYAELARACRASGCIVVTDFHPDAVAAGHRRTFRDESGAIHEIEHHVHAPEAHRSAAADAGLALALRRDGVVGESIRQLYEAAGRHAAYETQRGLPIVLALVFTHAA